jgi:hypothetical protein
MKKLSLSFAFNYSLISAMSANEMFQCAPCVVLHELLGQLFVLGADGVQQRCHLRLHFRPETIQAVDI